MLLSCEYRYKFIEVNEQHIAWVEVIITQLWNMSSGRGVCKVHRPQLKELMINKATQRSYLHENIGS